MRHAGETIEVARRHGTSTLATGEIVEVLDAGEHEHYRVRWDDGRESVYYPRAEKPPEPRARPPRQRAARGTPAAPARPALRAAPGDRLVVHPHHLGEPPRDAEVLEALGPDGGPPFRVRWSDDGRETTLFPGSDTRIERLARRRRARP
jgi:Domain of unknown function (DUF1918)